MPDKKKPLAHTLNTSLEALIDKGVWIPGNKKQLQM